MPRWASGQSLTIANADALTIRAIIAGTTPHMTIAIGICAPLPLADFAGGEEQRSWAS